MEAAFRPSTLEILPDEILLEVCQYLLSVDILYSFFELNSRMRRMISQYYHHVSLHKASITQSTHLCVNVLPHIGPQIRSILLDRCYAVMQHELFIRHFKQTMARVFPSLQKISLVGFQYSHIMTFLETLHDLDKLDEIHLSDLFAISEDRQADVLRALLQANNNRLTSVLINFGSSCLKFHPTDCYMNIRRLHIIMTSASELLVLFAAVPSVRHLHVTLDEEGTGNISSDDMHICPLQQLVDFHLRSTRRWWNTEELAIILDHMPNAQTIALFLCVLDAYLVHGNTLLSVLPSTIEQFHYAIFYAPVSYFEHEDHIMATWPSSHPIICYHSDEFGFLHTLPWHFRCMSLPTSIGNVMSTLTNRPTAYAERVRRLEVIVDKKMSLSKSLAVLAMCCHVKHLLIFISVDDSTVQEEQKRRTSLPVLSELTQVYIYASTPVDFDQLSSIFFAAPNLLRVDLPCDYLLHLLENQQLRDRFGQRLKSVAVLNASKSSSVKLNEEHIHVIASSLTSVGDVYFDVTHLTPSVASESDEIMPSSMESMLRCLLFEFRVHKLISLVVDLQSSEAIRTNAKEWLHENTILQQQPFDAAFNQELDRLIVWM